MKKAVFYGVVLIGIYLVAVNATGSGTVITAGTDGGLGLVGLEPCGNVHWMTPSSWVQSWSQLGRAAGGADAGSAG